MKSQLLAVVLSLNWLSFAQSAERSDFFRIKVVDDQTERGVPLVELKTVSQQRFFTDSAGVVAIREPELFGQTVFFSVSSHGYEFAKDGFGFRGKQIKVEPGGETTLKNQTAQHCRAAVSRHRRGDLRRQRVTRRETADRAAALERSSDRL